LLRLERRYRPKNRQEHRQDPANDRNVIRVTN
jgi:hypothetical protein